MFLILFLIAFCHCALMPVYTDTDCESAVLYYINYTIGDCYQLYDCDSEICGNLGACTGLTLDDFYPCMGCAPLTQSAIVNDTHYTAFASVDCSGFALSIGVSDSCWIDPSPVCTGMRVRLLQDNGTFHGTTGGTFTTTTVSSSGSNGSASSPAATIFSLLF